MNMELPEMNARRRRHKHGHHDVIPNDDVDMQRMLGDMPLDHVDIDEMSDLNFEEMEQKDTSNHVDRDYKVETDPKPVAQAVSGKSNAACSVNVNAASVLLTLCCYFLYLRMSVWYFFLCA